ncbi:DUF6609 family protein [Streptomyces sp. NPDC051561]|uniref:DUF6609 family protein n=1 Tax=Streptomyces sp. NPDC051561 TaxID=3365658 RepID=UPI0037BBDA3C
MIASPHLAALVPLAATTANDLPHPYPLIRGGGLFLLCVGLGFLLGWIFQSRWIPFAIGGGVAGFIASGLSALLPSLGSPSFVQIAGLVGSFVLEMGLIYLVISRYQKQQGLEPEKQQGLEPEKQSTQQDLKQQPDERTLILTILFVVGLHFLTMGLAHGPLMTILGLATSANALIGLYVAKSLPVRALGVTDALLKLGFGAWMLLAYPAVTFG